MSVRDQVEELLYREAALLDTWELDDWLALWTDDGRYIVPATDEPDGDPACVLALVADDMAQLRARVDQLREGRVHAELPRSRTARAVTNIRIVATTETEHVVDSVFVLYRYRAGKSETLAGRYQHRLTVDPIKIRQKRVIIANESVGSLSLLL
jgi:p-cumate 2,3-dioxygenase beta subunit